MWLPMLKSTDVVVIVGDAAVQSAIMFALDALGITAAIGPSLLAVKEDPKLASCRCLIVDDCGLGGDARSIATDKEGAGFLPVILIAACSSREVPGRVSATGFWHVVTMPIVDTSLFDAVLAALTLSHPPATLS
jgi:hypothetical protein